MDKQNDLRRTWLAAREQRQISRRQATGLIPMALMTLTAFEHGKHVTERTQNRIRKQLAKWDAETAKGKPGPRPKVHENGLVAKLADARRELESLKVYVTTKPPLDELAARITVSIAHLDLCLPTTAK